MTETSPTTSSENSRFYSAMRELALTRSQPYSMKTLRAETCSTGLRPRRAYRVTTLWDPCSAGSTFPLNFSQSSATYRLSSSFRSLPSLLLWVELLSGRSLTPQQLRVIAELSSLPGSGLSSPRFTRRYSDQLGQIASSLQLILRKHYVFQKPAIQPRESHVEFSLHPRLLSLNPSTESSSPPRRLTPSTWRQNWDKSLALGFLPLPMSELSSHFGTQLKSLEASGKLSPRNAQLKTWLESGSLGPP